MWTLRKQQWWWCIWLCSSWWGIRILHSYKTVFIVAMNSFPISYIMFLIIIKWPGPGYISTPGHSWDYIISMTLLEAWLLKYVLWRNALLHCFPITPRSVSAPGCSWRQGYYLHTPEELTISWFPNHSWECNCSPGCSGGERGAVSSSWSARCVPSVPSAPHSPELSGA